MPLVAARTTIGRGIAYGKNTQFDPCKSSSTTKIFFRFSLII